MIVIESYIITHNFILEMDSLWQLVLFLENCPKKIMRDEVRDLYAQMFITALFIIIKC